MSQTTLFFNGFDGDSGKYVMPPLSLEAALLLAGQPPTDKSHLQNLLAYYKEFHQKKQLGPAFGVDPLKLESAGWGLIMAENDPAGAAIKTALQPLLDLRRRQAGDHYREYLFKANDNKATFLGRNNAAASGPANPVRNSQPSVPYYLLIVASPAAIPYAFQYQLDVQYAVGRIHFATLADYAAYTEKLVACETGQVKRPRQATFFAVDHDPATTLSKNYLVTPLMEQLAPAGWQIKPLIGPQATKSSLSQQFNTPPSLLFTASHGMAFPQNHKLQARDQGALLCPAWQIADPNQALPVTPDDYFGAGDLPAATNLSGLMAFFFACFGAGTPSQNDFDLLLGTAGPNFLTPQPIVAPLPQTMLSRGALAVVGHVERAWSYSFFDQTVGSDPAVFASTLGRLMAGEPIGWAMEFFNQKYGELSTALTQELHDRSRGLGQQSDKQMVAWWLANNDARNYVIVGDPAGRLPLSQETTMTDTPLEINTPTPPVVPAGAIEPTDFSAIDTLLGRKPETDPAGENNPGRLNQLMQLMEDFAKKLGEATLNAVQNAVSLTVETYAAEEMAGVQFQNGKFVGPVQPTLAALTHIKADGDMVVCVPRDDQDLWAIHADMVRQAQAHRAAMLKLAVDTITGLAKLA